MTTSNEKNKPQKNLPRLLLTAVGWIFVVAFFPIVMPIVKHESKAVKCERVKTNIKTSDNMLISEAGLKNIVRREFPNLVGSKLNEINYAEMEATLEHLPVVKSCQVFPSMDGTVHVKINQRRPVMRVFTSDGSYYMDAEGYKIVARGGMRTHTVIVNGAVNSMLNVDGLVKLCSYIDNHDFWRSMIEQVTVTQKHEFLLIPRVGDHVVEFGSADNLETKFSNLLALYKYGWEKQEWNVYSKVNVKYKGQIICTKRNS